MPVECPPPCLAMTPPTPREVRSLLACWRRETPSAQRVPWIVRAVDGSVSVVYARTTHEGLVQFEGDAVRSGRPPEARWWEPVGPGGPFAREDMDPTRGGWSSPVEALLYRDARGVERDADGAPRIPWDVAVPGPRRWRLADRDGRLRWFAAPWLVSSYAFACDLAMDGWCASAKAWALVLFAGALVILALYLRRE